MGGGGAWHDAGGRGHDAIDGGVWAELYDGSAAAVAGGGGVVLRVVELGDCGRKKGCFGLRWVFLKIAI